MAQGNYKINEEIEVTYQALNSQTGLTITMEIFDATHEKDTPNFPDVVMTEIGATGRYYGVFTPDVEGRWTIEIVDENGTGKVVKQFAVAGHDIDSVGDAVANIPTKVELSAVETNIINTVTNPPMVG